MGFQHTTNPAYTTARANLPPQPDHLLNTQDLQEENADYDYIDLGDVTFAQETID